MSALLDYAPAPGPDPLVSVVLPVYNGMPFLRRSIDSVLGQTMPNLELIVWNDGSVDDSANAIRRYQDPRIRVFSHHANRGLFESLNAAIGKARGRLIRLWSQDDIMKPQCLEVEAEFLARHPEVAMSYCQYDAIDVDGAFIGPAKEDETPDVIPPALANQIMFYYASITGNIANVTIRRETLAQLGLFREDLRVAGDFEMWVRIARTRSIGFVRRSLVCLRVHKGQFSRRNGIGVQFMRECRPIFREILDRLPVELQPYARRYYRRHHLLLDTHYMMRSLVAGDVRTAGQAFEEISHSGSPWRLVALLCLTLDRRLFRLMPKYMLE